MRRSLRAALLLALAAWLSPGGASAHEGALFLRGDVTVSSTWQGIVRLTGRVVIGEGVTVTVEPGTEVLVQPLADADIVVRGRLLVRGRPDRPVLFDTAGGCRAGPWGGIVFEKGSAGILEHVRVHCAGKGVGGDLANVRSTAVTVAPAGK
jgi:hypothetical protein